MDRRKFLTATAAFATAPLALSAPAIARTGSRSIVELAAGTPELSTLVTAVQAAGLVDTLAGPGNFTVFAPTNAAFAALPAGTLDALLADIPALTNILTYHVSADYYPAEALLGQRGRVPTVQGDFMRIDARGAGVHINGSTAVTTADVFASNGVVHVIDGVLLPH
jgi:uncharacterized surface protein with fasciclin (FAS1) repeats